MSRTLAQLARARWQLAGVAVFTAVSLLLTLLVAGTLAKGGTPSSRTVSAEFRDATGLTTGDDVRIAGVRVGKVTGVRLDGSHALVTFLVDRRQPVYTDTIAKIDYLNLMGQRYVALSDPDGPSRPLPDGAVIPLSRTRQGLDLNAMFNAFKPLFELIRPSDVNQLATNVVAVLQGEGGALRRLTDQTAQVTATLADRDRVIGAVIGNLDAVMGTLDSHHTAIASIVDHLGALTHTVARQRGQVAATLNSVSALVDTFTGLVQTLHPTVDRDVRSLDAWSTSFAKETPRLAAALKDVQLLLATDIKTLGLGSYLNTYVCTSTIAIGRLNGPQTLVPLRLGPEHSRRCP